MKYSIEKNLTHLKKYFNNVSLYEKFLVNDSKYKGTEIKEIWELVIRNDYGVFKFDITPYQKITLDKLVKARYLLRKGETKYIAWNDSVFGKVLFSDYTILNNFKRLVESIKLKEKLNKELNDKEIKQTRSKI